MQEIDYIKDKVIQIWCMENRIQQKITIIAIFRPSQSQQELEKLMHFQMTS